MTPDEALGHLARLAGLEDGWWDFFGNWRPVPIETKRLFLAAMGFKVGDEAEIRASLTELENRPWTRWLEPVLVLDEDDPAPAIALTIPAERDRDQLEWTLEEENGATHGGRFQVDTLPWSEERWIDGRLIKRWRFPIPKRLPLGYHRFWLTAADGTAAAMVLAVAPARAFIPPAIERGAGLWGVAAQVYSLRSASDWGVGTYGALKDLAAGAARLGAATVGVNPLHALFPTQPERFSPYSASARRFLNVTYVDIEAIPEFSECMEARRMFASPGFQASLARLRGYRLVEYADVAQTRGPILECLYRWFRKTHLEPMDARGRDFVVFQRQGGREARLFAVFEALQERFLKDGTGGYWRQWPEAYRRPDSPEVERFAQENAERVEFFQWLQFVADSQLGQAHGAALAEGAPIGLYRDMGVGIAADGGEAWMEQDQLALGVSVGAPPDPLALKGQDWGLVPYNPIALREAAYAPLIAALAANMRHAGALRLDHAMSLQRLYWVPQGMPADQGAYVRYPVDDLFRLVALESRRNGCLVIGEDLGTVPEGFRERMDRMGIFSYRVLVFEQDGVRLRPPGDLAAQALCIFATHDLPSVRGYWNGIDIANREKLDLYPREGMAEDERRARQADRDRMVDALAGAGLLRADFPRQGPIDEAQARELSLAAQLYLARAPSRLMMVQLEDVLGLEVQMNLPGTTTQHPNWRRRLPVDVPALLRDPLLCDLAARLKEGGRASQR